MGSAGEFERLALPLQNDLYFAALALSHHESDALDLVQDAYLRAFRAFDRFRPSGGGFKAWIFTILRNAYLDRCRARRESPVDFEASEEPAAGPDAASLPLREILDDDLLRALRSLSPRHRTLVLLADIEGLAYKEIAEVLGCPIGSVMSGLFNARARLRAALHVPTADS
ncbi:MAG: sigma-70 family RNA polymerase sigma factor [Planctomycetes bacterium]|nr:sigma-70 family RNA polymerase sigma factor [Planctomycetota bacterium]